MKRKSPRGIPDFGRQAPRTKGDAKPDAAPASKSAAPPPPRTQRAKPQSTSAKSGQRGQ